jgi:hypothetical protein
MLNRAQTRNNWNPYSPAAWISEEKKGLSPVQVNATSTDFNKNNAEIENTKEAKTIRTLQLTPKSQKKCFSSQNAPSSKNALSSTSPSQIHTSKTSSRIHVAMIHIVIHVIWLKSQPIPQTPL